MAYLPNIPQPTDRISVSQNDLLENFTQLNTIFGTDHITFNAAANNGKHNQLTLINRTGAVPSFTLPDVGLYSADDVAGGSGRRELWSSSSALTYPITAGNRAAAGWARVGGGIYLVWRSQTSIANTTTDTTLDLTHCPASGTILSAEVSPFPTDISGTNANYTVVITGIGATVTVAVLQRATATLTRVASQRFTFLVVRL